jgi:outer membrane lipoprotein carrier protein
MKKYIILLTITLFAGIGVKGQDTKAGAILDAMSARYKALKGFRAEFAYTPVSGAGKLGRKSLGDLTVKGDKYKLNIAGQEIYNNGSAIYSFVKEVNEVSITDYESGGSEFSPAAIYSIHKQGYKYSYKGEKSIGGTKYDVVDLLPLKPDNSIKKLEIAVHKSTREVKQWKLWDSTGGHTVFDILQFTPNLALADSFFTFNTAKYPGVEVVDLR